MNKDLFGESIIQIRVSLLTVIILPSGSCAQAGSVRKRKAATIGIRKQQGRKALIISDLPPP